MKNLLLVAALLFMAGCAEDLGKGGGKEVPFKYSTRINVSVTRLTDDNRNDRYYETTQGLSAEEETLTSYFVYYHDGYVWGSRLAWVRVTVKTAYDPLFPVLSLNDSANFNIYTITVTTGGRGLSLNPNEPDWVGSMSVSRYYYDSLIRDAMIHMLSYMLREMPSGRLNGWISFDRNGNPIFD